ncbi:MAG: hypothetical protein HFG34_00645 [Eubacterium sp.]|nr:hypothetical protein [Eubacterium sp.]
MKIRKAMALALAGTLVLTTAVTGTTSEAAKKTKLKTKKVSIYVKGKKKISITGKKAKHKYTFTSKKKKIAKVSKKGVITGVKAGKTTITVKDTWKQKGKKKTKKLGTINVTVKKKKTPVVTPKVTPQVPQPPASQVPAPPTTQAPDGGGTPTAPPDNPGTETNRPTATPPTTGTPTQTPIGKPTPTPTGEPTPPPAAQQTPTVYKPVNLADVEQVEGVTYNEETKSISVKNVEQFAIPLGYSVQKGHAIWVKLKGKLNGEQGFRSWLVNSVDNKGTMSNQWNATSEPGFKAPGEFEYTFQLVSEADDVSALLIKGAAYQVNIDDIELTSIETSYPIKDPTPPEQEVKAPTASLTIDKPNIRAGEKANAAVTVSDGEVTDVTWAVVKSDVASVAKDSKDANKAVITGVTEGETKVTAEVKVTVEGKDFTVKAEGMIHVAAKDALVVNATVESAPTEIQIAETAEMSVKVDAGEDIVTIEDVVWAVTEGEAATIDTESLEKGKVRVIGQKEGDVTISVTVTVKKGDKTATDTKEVTIHVTPITHNIGKTLTFNGEAVTGENVWVALNLDEPLRIKKTDKVEVVFSAKAGESADSPDDTTTIFKMAMAPGIEEGVMTAYKLQEKATLRNDATRVGRAEFTINKANFASNYSEINSIVGSITSTSTEAVVVTVEKVLITPTEKIALSLQAPGTFDKGAETVLQAEVDENDFTEIEWKSSDESIATVAADNDDPRKAIVNGVGEGEVTITVTVKKGDQVSEESVTRKVVDNYKNKPLKLDLTAVKSNTNQCVVNSDGSITIKGEANGGAGIPLPHELFTGDKIKVTVKGKFTGSGSFRLYPSVDLVTGSSTYTFGRLTDTGYVANWDVPAEQQSIQAALCTVNADKTFEVKDLEFEASKENVVNILFRQPSDGIIITEMTVTYL